MAIPVAAGARVLLGAVGLFADGLGIYSFFSDDSEDRDNRINSNLNEIRDQLSSV